MRSHYEERSDEAISHELGSKDQDCFAALAMTIPHLHRGELPVVLIPDDQVARALLLTCLSRHNLLVGFIEIHLAEVTMRRLVPVISLTISVFLVLSFRNARAEEFNAEPPEFSIRWLEYVLEQQPSGVSTEEGMQDFTDYTQEDEWLLWGVEGTQPHLTYVQWGAGGRRTVRCESQDNRHAYCRTYTSGRVRLQQQLSKTPCREYETWGVEGDGSGIWVRNGCRAIFVVGRGGGGSGGGGGGWGENVTCKSENYKYNHCPVYRGRGKVRMSRQLSDASCVRGSSWGADRDGIWVNNGCAAEFEIR